MEGIQHFVALVVDGLGTGSIYSILALALVLVYRTTNIVNFSQGELAMLSTMLASTLLRRWSPWLAVPSVLLLSGLLGAVLQWVVLRKAGERRELNSIIITIGLLVIIRSVALWLYGPIPEPFPSPIGEGGYRWGGVVIGYHPLFILFVTALVSTLTYVLFEHSRVGLGLRAAAQNWMAARLMGVRVERMFALGWVLASILGAVAGMVAAPQLFVYPTMMQSVLVYAFAGAVVGGLSSATGAITGGLLVGIVEHIAGTLNVVGSELKTVVAFAVLITVLVLRPRGIFGKRIVRAV